MNERRDARTRYERVRVMGILNVTPDSFYDGGDWSSCEDAVRHGLDMARDGADLIDVGGESSRPGSQGVSAAEEIARVVPVVTRLAKRLETPISIDTTKADVAEAALAAGATIVNDISALRSDPGMIDVVRSRDATVVLMHMQGTPQTMQDDPRYDDVVGEVREFLADRMEFAIRRGVLRNRVILDPGIGFGKRLEDNLALLAGLDALVGLGAPVLVGLSRKSFLGKLLDQPADERLVGTIAANAIAIRNGARIIRVHDVKQGRWTADVASRLRPAAR